MIVPKSVRTGQRGLYRRSGSGSRALLQESSEEWLQPPRLCAPCSRAALRLDAPPTGAGNQPVSRNDEQAEKGSDDHVIAGRQQRFRDLDTWLHERRGDPGGSQSAKRTHPPALSTAGPDHHTPHQGRKADERFDRAGHSTDPVLDPRQAVDNARDKLR